MIFETSKLFFNFLQELFCRCRSLIRISGRYDSAVWLLTERFTNALIEIDLFSLRMCNSIAPDQPWPCAVCVCVFSCPLSPNVYRIRGSVIIVASHIRATYLARTPEFIYSNLFMFTRDDSVTCIGLDLLHYLAFADVYVCVRTQKGRRCYGYKLLGSYEKYLSN